MKLIVGLGNPGREYIHSRHNAGFQVLSKLGRSFNIKFDCKLGLARTGHGNINQEEIVLAKPQTYMNLCGLSVSRLVRRLKLNPSDLIVVYDDMNLSLGKIRIRLDGSSGGHRGLSSIINELGYKNFLRLRLGIGRPGEADGYEAEAVSHVLGNFRPEEKLLMAKVIPQAVEAIRVIISDSPEVAMNRFN
jgi:PTH1 family peptidyl-tRNA hydrolase